MEWALLGVAATAGLIAVGFVIGYSATGSVGFVIGPSSTPSTCSDFCTAWQMSRAAVCSAVSSLQSAQAIADTLAKVAGALAAAAIAAAVLAVAGGWIPFVGPTLVAASITAAATATTLAAVAAGAGANALLMGKQLTDAQNAETAARLSVFEHCTGDALTQCLAMPAPC